MKVLSKLIAVLALLFWAGMGVLAFEEAPSHDGTGSGTPACNCSSSTTTGANVPHSATVGVSVDNGGTSVPGGQHDTGNSGTAYGNQTVAPTMCLYVRYIFNCTQFEGQWACTIQSFSLQERPATTGTGGDCP